MGFLRDSYGTSVICLKDFKDFPCDFEQNDMN